MKCPKCSKELKSQAKVCKFCGYDLSKEVFWQPPKKWHLQVLGIIFFSLGIIYLILHFLLSKYVRNIPNPW